MNKDRRKQIAKAQDALSELMGSVESIKADVESIRDDEQDYLDNMPESLLYSEKGEKANAAIAALDEAIDALDALITSDVVESLNTAAE